MLTQVSQTNDLFYLLSDDSVAMTTMATPSSFRGKSGAPVVYKLVIHSKEDGSKKTANNSRLPVWSDRMDFQVASGVKNI